MIEFLDTLTGELSEGEIRCLVILCRAFASHGDIALHLTNRIIAEQSEHPTNALCTLAMCIGQGEVIATRALSLVAKDDFCGLDLFERLLLYPSGISEDSMGKFIDCLEKGDCRSRILDILQVAFRKRLRPLCPDLTARLCNKPDDDLWTFLVPLLRPRPVLDLATLASIANKEMPETASRAFVRFAIELLRATNSKRFEWPENRIGDPISDPFVLRDLDLKGIDTIKEMYFKGTVEEAVDLAEQFLVRLQMFAEDRRAAVAKVAELRGIRGIRLIRKFVETAESGADPGDFGKSRLTPRSGTVRFTIKCVRSFELAIREEATIEELKVRIAAHEKMSTSDVVLRGVPPGAWRIADFAKMEVEVKGMSNASPGMEPIGPTLPSLILVERGFAGTLLEMFDENDKELSAEVWELLSLLPADPRLESVDVAQFAEQM
jgi:hypothetical protein